MSEAAETRAREYREQAELENNLRQAGMEAWLSIGKVIDASGTHDRTIELSDRVQLHIAKSAFKSDMGLDQSGPTLISLETLTKVRQDRLIYQPRERSMVFCDKDYYPGGFFIPESYHTELFESKEPDNSAALSLRLYADYLRPDESEFTHWEVSNVAMAVLAHMKLSRYELGQREFESNSDLAEAAS